MTISANYVPEPLLEFGYGQKVEHPQDGLFLYGPVQTSDKPETVHVASQGIALAKQWLQRINGRIDSEDASAFHTANWPGFAAVFGSRLPASPLVAIEL